MSNNNNNNSSKYNNNNKNNFAATENNNIDFEVISDIRDSSRDIHDYSAAVIADKSLCQ
jgi:hypothetical protein